jgi:hypothetical protein
MNKESETYEYALNDMTKHIRCSETHFHSQQNTKYVADRTTQKWEIRVKLQKLQPNTNNVNAINP